MYNIMMGTTGQVCLSVTSVYDSDVIKLIHVMVNNVNVMLVVG